MEEDDKNTSSLEKMDLDKLIELVDSLEDNLSIAFGFYLGNS